MVELNFSLLISLTWSNAYGRHRSLIPECQGPSPRSVQKSVLLIGVEWTDGRMWRITEDHGGSEVSGKERTQLIRDTRGSRSFACQVHGLKEAWSSPHFEEPWLLRSTGSSDGDTDKAHGYVDVGTVCHHLRLITTHVVLIGWPCSWRIHSVGAVSVM